MKQLKKETRSCSVCSQGVHGPVKENVDDDSWKELSISVHPNEKKKMLPKWSLGNKEKVF